MPSTYTPIQTHTLPSNATSYTFTNIPQTYDDLVLVTSLMITSGGATNDRITFNGDTAANYSTTIFYANNSIWGSYRVTNSQNAVIDDVTSTEFNVNEHHIIGYKNTSFYKTSIGQSSPPSSSVQQNIQRWANTAAITSMTITSPATFIAGSTFTLYGIKNA